MRYTVKQKCMLGKAENKGNATLYTLLALPSLDKIVAIGKHIDGLTERSTVEAVIEITTKSERFELKGQDKAHFVETARIYISDVKEIGE